MSKEEVNHERVAEIAGNVDFFIRENFNNDKPIDVLVALESIIAVWLQVYGCEDMDIESTAESIAESIKEQYNYIHKSDMFK